MFDKSAQFEDLSELFTKDNADKGVWVQFVSLGKKWNMDVKILGSDADEVQLYNRQKVKEMQKHINIAGGRSVDLDDDAMDSILENKNEEALVRFIGIRKHDDKSALSLKDQKVPIEKNAENEQIYANILFGMPALKDFIMRESGERTNFLSKGKKN